MNIYLIFRKTFELNKLIQNPEYQETAKQLNREVWYRLKNGPAIEHHSKKLPGQCLNILDRIV